MSDEIFIHETAEIEDGASVGKGTKVWHQAQVMSGATIGENSNLGKGVFIAAGVVVGSRVKIQNYVSLYKGVTIEDDVILGPHVTFTNDLYPRASDKEYTVYETLVKQGTSIGANSTIVCGVTLNEYSMIAAGAVVTCDVPAFALVTGNPGRIAGYVCKCGMRIDIEKSPTQDKKSKSVECSRCGASYEFQVGLIPVL